VGRRRLFALTVMGSTSRRCRTWVIDIRYAPVVDNAGADSFQACRGSNAAELIRTQRGLRP
jgi:hypothetical protein